MRCRFATPLTGKIRSSTTSNPYWVNLIGFSTIVHGCRRCVSLCNALPTLFDLVDGSKTLGG